MERVFHRRTSVERALQQILKVTAPLEDVERVSLDDAVGRVLAQDVRAERDVPHYDRAAMDGYAVRAEDTWGASPSNPVMLDLADRAGRGRAVRVHTGSAMPPGADAVVMIEDTELLGDRVEVKASTHPGKHVGEQGEDIEEGELVVPVGRRIRPEDVALLAGLNLEEIGVYRRPRVAVIPTGEELVPRGTVPGPGEMIETNGLMVREYAREWGAHPIQYDIVTDDPGEIESVLREVEADAIALCGGTSVGKRDLVPDAVEKTGELLVHGVLMSPGKPTALGQINDTPVVCLPGYPVACAVAARVFLRPVIGKLGHVPLVDHRVRATLAGKIASKTGFETWARVRVEDDVVVPVMTSGSGILSSVVRANGYVVVPPETEGYEEGCRVEVILFE